MALNITLHGRLLIKRLRLIRIARDAKALFIERRKPVLRRGKALRRSLVIPLRRCLQIPRQHAAVGVTHRKRELRQRAPVARFAAQVGEGDIALP